MTCQATGATIGSMALSNEQRAEVLRQAWELRLGGWSHNDIARKLGLDAVTKSALDLTSGGEPIKFTVTIPRVMRVDEGE